MSWFYCCFGLYWGYVLLRAALYPQTNDAMVLPILNASRFFFLKLSIYLESKLGRGPQLFISGVLLLFNFAFTIHELFIGADHSTEIFSKFDLASAILLFLTYSLNLLVHTTAFFVSFALLCTWLGGSGDEPRPFLRNLQEFYQDPRRMSTSEFNAFLKNYQKAVDSLPLIAYELEIIKNQMSKRKEADIKTSSENINDKILETGNSEHGVPSRGRDTWDGECVICLESLRSFEAGQLACRHVFHVECLVSWFRVKPRCPCCQMGVRTILMEIKQAEGRRKEDVKEV